MTAPEKIWINLYPYDGYATYEMDGSHEYIRADVVDAQFKTLTDNYMGACKQLGIEVGRVDDLRQENERLKAALEAVEWIEIHRWAKETHPAQCAWCSRLKWKGHASDCRRQTALGLTP